MIDDLVKYCLTEVAYEGELGARCLHYLYLSFVCTSRRPD
jgi:hypothetical protein